MVAASNGSQSSAAATSASATAGVFTLTASAVQCQAVIALSWPNVPNESGYQIRIAQQGAPSYSFLALVPANVTSYQVIFNASEANKKYFFVVQPYIGIETNVIGDSNQASAIVDIPATMTSKTGTSGTPGSVFSHTFTHVSAATVSTRTLTGAPAGLSFNSSTGALSGVYPALGNYTLTYAVKFTTGSTLTQTFHIRVRPPAGPPAVGTPIPAWNGVAGASRDTVLAGTFTDAEAESAVRVSTTLGDMDFILFNTATPATVANFMNYVGAGKYTDVAFHRSVANFVIQGGGFKGTGTDRQFTSILTDPPVANEPGVANVRGTVSMAKAGNDPNSATSQFFVSTADNRANLDYQNGGFTVFGRVAGNGMAVADAINLLPTRTYNLFVNDSDNTTEFKDFPMNAASAPATMDQTKLVKVNSVTTIPTLGYSITGNTNPAVAAASIDNGQLHLVGLAGGQTTITVAATDLDNLTTSQTVAVNLTDTYAAWTSRNSFPGGQNGPGQNPDGDGWNNLLEYAFLGNPALADPLSQVVFPGTTGTAPAARYMTLTFPVRKFTQGLTYAVEANDGLSGAWTEIWKSTSGFAHPQVVSAVDQADRTVVTIKDTAALGGRPKRFLRTRIAQE
jgi:cyclophilin family peptidyl-prolyl cis-trans isomerase